MRLFRSGMFWLFFVLPMVAGTVYYAKFASKQYQASAHFTIEKSGKDLADPLGALTGLPGNVSSTRDALIIKNFIESREVIERTRDDFDLKALYAREDKDWLSRLETDSSIEDTVEYWRKKVSVEFDASSGIIILTVMAFEPESAVKVINAILKESDRLVNTLSEKSRQDSLTFAKSELQKAENKLKQARADVRDFRDKEQILSPDKNAESKLLLVDKLDADRARAEAELQSLRLELPEHSPKIETAKFKVAALKRQVEKERQRSALGLSEKDPSTMSALISRYEELITEQGFAEKSYEVALLNIEAARIDATRKQRYLTMVVYPKLPEEPVKPDQPYDYFVLFVACLLTWGILSLIVASVKDHAGWV